MQATVRQMWSRMAAVANAQARPPSTFATYVVHGRLRRRAPSCKISISRQGNFIAKKSRGFDPQSIELLSHSLFCRVSPRRLPLCNSRACAPFAYVRSPASRKTPREKGMDSFDVLGPSITPIGH